MEIDEEEMKKNGTYLSNATYHFPRSVRHYNWLEDPSWDLEVPMINTIQGIKKLKRYPQTRVIRRIDIRTPDKCGVGKDQ